MPLLALAIGLALAAGYGADRRYGASATRAARRLLALLLYAVVPPIAFFNVARLDASADVVGGLLLAALTIALVGVAAWAIATYALRLERPAVGALIAVAMQPNSGYVGVPLVLALLGAARLGQAVAFDAMLSMPWMFGVVFGVGAAFGSEAGHGGAERLRAFLTRNPPLFAVLAGLLAPASLAPDAAVEVTRVLALAAAPVCFFAVGAILAGEARGAARPFPPPLSRPVLVALALKLAVAPLVLFLLALPLLQLPHIYLLLVAMPAGFNTIVAAQVYGLDRPLAAGAIAWGTVLVVLAALALSVLAR